MYFFVRTAKMYTSFSHKRAGNMATATTVVLSFVLGLGLFYLGLLI